MRESTERTFEIDKADNVMIWEKTWGDKKAPVCVQVVEYDSEHNKTRLQFSLSRTATVDLIKRLLETIDESKQDFGPMLVVAGLANKLEKDQYQANESPNEKEGV